MHSSIQHSHQYSLQGKNPTGAGCAFTMLLPPRLERIGKSRERDCAGGTKWGASSQSWLELAILKAPTPISSASVPTPLSPNKQGITKSLWWWRLQLAETAGNECRYVSVRNQCSPLQPLWAKEPQWGRQQASRCNVVHAKEDWRAEQWNSPKSQPASQPAIQLHQGIYLPRNGRKKECMGSTETEDVFVRTSIEVLAPESLRTVSFWQAHFSSDL